MSARTMVRATTVALFLSLLMVTAAWSEAPRLALEDGEETVLAQDPSTADHVGTVLAAASTPQSAGCSVSVSGCFSSGSELLCFATASGGSGSYNYWWLYSGPGELYQTNSSSVTIGDCSAGTGTLSVSVRDRNTGASCFSAPYRVTCGGAC